jgi:chromosomal replication initiator protein
LEDATSVRRIKDEQEVIRDAQEVVAALRKQLTDQIGPERFDLWFGDQVRFELTSSGLLVYVPDQFVLDRLRKQFRSEIAAAADRLFQPGTSVEYQVRAIEKKQPGSRRTAAKASRRQLSLLPDVPVEQLAPLQRSAARGPTRPRRSTAAAKTLDSFVHGVGNRLAVTAAQSICERPGRMTPLFLYGPPGCGKTHLQEAICHATRQTLGVRRVVALSSEQFTSMFLEALQGSGLPSFRRKCREVDVLAVDDIQFFAGKRATLVELQHTIDSLMRKGKQLVLTADRPPSDLTNLGPELITRVSGGLVCAIELADFETRLGIARTIAPRCRRPVPDDVLRLVAHELGGDARQVEGAINRLDATSEALGQAITLDLAKASLQDLFRATHRIVRLPDIERAICETFDLDARSLHDGRKTKASSHPRMLAMWLARKYTRAAFSEISEYFGRRSHSTVISAEKKVSGWVADRATVQLGQSACNVEDAIRRIETRLRMG